MPIASPAIRKLPRSDATISGLAELQGVADRTAALVKQAVRRTARAAFSLCGAAGMIGAPRA